MIKCPKDFLKQQKNVKHRCRHSRWWGIIEATVNFPVRSDAIRKVARLTCPLMRRRLSLHLASSITVAAQSQTLSDIEHNVKVRHANTCWMWKSSSAEWKSIRLRLHESFVCINAHGEQKQRRRKSATRVRAAPNEDTRHRILSGRAWLWVHYSSKCSDPGFPWLSGTKITGRVRSLIYSARWQPNINFMGNLKLQIGSPGAAIYKLEI